MTDGTLPHMGEPETAAGGRFTARQRLRMVIAAQLALPVFFLAWRVATGVLLHGGWSWGMYAP